MLVPLLLGFILKNTLAPEDLPQPARWSKVKRMTEIRMESQDYDSIARMNDKEVYGHLAYVNKLFKKPVVPRKIKANGFRVSRSKNRVTVHLCLDKNETCRVSFIPLPAFTSAR